MIKKITACWLIVCLLLVAGSVCAVERHESLKTKFPLMGWASWNQFGAGINENLLKRQACAMVSSGLLDAGFKYLNIDDGFFNRRYADGSLRIDSVKFPGGMKSLVDYIHAKGLKAGFYSEAGENTCGYQYSGQPGGMGGGLYNHDQQDADLFFKVWGFDFLKVDYCGGLVLKLDEKTRYSAVRKAIDNTGRADINFNVCRWQFPGTWVTKIADSWRMSHDINFIPGSKPKWTSILSIIKLNKYLAPYAGPGHYNDMDMLEVGRGMSFDEDKSHFGMWCILSSPLVLGMDMEKLSAETKSIITNPEVIAVNQDPAGLQARLLFEKDSLQVWAKHLNGQQSNQFAVALFNQGTKTARIAVAWKDLNIVGSAKVRDLYARADVGVFPDGYEAEVPPHGISLIKVDAQKTMLQEVFEAEYAWLNNFNLTVNAEIVPDQAKPVAMATASGLAKVVKIGNNSDNFIEFRDVYANRSGNYQLDLFYIAETNRSAELTVNGKTITLSDFNSGGKDVIAKRTLPIQLKRGYNTIRIANSTNWAPDIDRIVINLSKR